MESGSFLLRVTSSGLSGQEMETAGVGGQMEVGVVRRKCGTNHSRELNRLIIESGVYMLTYQPVFQYWCNSC